MPYSSTPSFKIFCACSFVRKEKPSKHSLPSAPSCDIPVRVSRFNTIFTSALLSSVIPGVLKRHGLITSSSSVSKTSIPVSSFSSLFAVTSNGSSSTLSAGSISPAGTLSKNCPAGYRNSRFSRSLGSPLDGFQIVMQLTASGSIF